MNKVVRTSSIIQYQGFFNHHFQLQASFFHSSPILQRKRRSNYDSRYSNSFNRRIIKMNRKNQFVSDAGAFAEELFKSWKYHDENYRPQTPPWLKQEFVSNKNKGGRSRKTGSNPGSGRRFDFCVDDEFDVEESEFEDVFHAAFGGNKHFDWSSTDEEPEREYTSRYNTRSERYRRYEFDDEYDSSEYTSSYNTRSGRYRRYEFDDEYDSSEESNCSAADSTSYRRALGLKATGPLRLEDVKNAYRACALKWHPDRHQGSSKVVAEEKFKICSAAYESLCDQMVS